MKKIIAISSILMLITFALLKLNDLYLHESYLERLEALKKEITYHNKSNNGLPKNAKNLLDKYTPKDSAWWCDKKKLPTLKGLGHCDYNLSENENEYTLRVGEYHYWLVYVSQKDETYVDNSRDFIVGIDFLQMLPFVVFVASFLLGLLYRKSRKHLRID